MKTVAVRLNSVATLPAKLARRAAKDAKKRTTLAEVGLWQDRRQTSPPSQSSPTTSTERGSTATNTTPPQTQTASPPLHHAGLPVESVRQARRLQGAHRTPRTQSAAQPRSLSLPCAMRVQPGQIAGAPTPTSRAATVASASAHPPAAADANRNP